MVLHDPATDPKHVKTESGKNPHVHLVVKSVSETGERLYIRKDTLQTWREQFAYALREQGIEANATPAAIRGKAKSSAKGAIHQHQERLEKWRTGAQEEQNPQHQLIGVHLAAKPRRPRSGRSGEWRQAGLNRQRQAHGHLRTGFEWLESHRERCT